MRSPVARIRRALAGRPRRIVAVVAVVVLVAAALVWVARPQSPDFRTESALVTVRSGPSGDEPVELDTTLYLPDRASEANRVPAVLLAHGFGGTKDSVRSDAEDLAARGYAVLTWTARGFGRSGGQIHLDSPDYEVRDAQRLLDTGQMIFGIFVIGLIGLISDFLFKTLNERVFPWYAAK